MFNKKIIHQYSCVSLLPTQLAKYFKDYMPLSLDAIFEIEGKEVLVGVGDYLIKYKNRLYYYPKDIYEAKANRNLVGRREGK